MFPSGSIYNENKVPSFNTSLLILYIFYCFTSLLMFHDFLLLYIYIYTTPPGGEQLQLRSCSHLFSNCDSYNEDTHTHTMCSEPHVLFVMEDVSLATDVDRD